MDYLHIKLPPEYQRVEWIKPAAHDNNYIDTGLYLTNNDIIKIDIKVGEYPPSEIGYGIMGARSGFASRNISISQQQLPEYGMICDFNNSNGNTYRYTNNSITVDERITLVSGATERGIVDVSLNENVWSGEFTTQYTCYIGLTNNFSTYSSTSEIYYAEIVNRFIGIPCYRINDNKIGMYDLISQTFKASTGNWVKGADIIDGVGGRQLRTKRKSLLLPQVPSLLPDGYTPVKCLLFYSGQWIDTGITLTNDDSISIDVEFKDYPLAGSVQCIMGGRFAYNSRNISISVQGGNIVCDFRNNNSSEYQYLTVDYAANTRYHIFTNKNSRGVSGIGSNDAVWNGDFVCDGTCYIGSWNPKPSETNYIGFVGAVYEADILGKWHGIPCYRNSDRELGMFDTISQTFFTNVGIGSLNAVYLDPPVGYKQIEYIEATGTQWFDTGILSDGKVRIDMNVLPTSVSTAGSQVWFGCYDGTRNYYVGPGRSANMNIVYQYYSNIYDINFDLTTYTHLKTIQAGGTASTTQFWIYPNSVSVPTVITYQSKNSFMFNRNNYSGVTTNLASKIKLFNSRIWNGYGGDGLKRNYVPFLRESDNVAGLYDFKNNQFKTSMTSTEFIAGGFV